MKQSSTPTPESDASTTETRQQRITEIRRQLAQGTYEISSASLATAILDTMLERGSKKHRAA